MLRGITYWHFLRNVAKLESGYPFGKAGAAPAQRGSSVPMRKQALQSRALRQYLPQHCTIFNI